MTAPDSPGPWGQAMKRFLKSNSSDGEESPRQKKVSRKGANEDTDSDDSNPWGTGGWSSDSSSSGPWTVRPSATVAGLDKKTHLSETKRKSQRGSVNLAAGGLGFAAGAIMAVATQDAKQRDSNCKKSVYERRGVDRAACKAVLRISNRCRCRGTVDKGQPGAGVQAEVHGVDKGQPGAGVQAEVHGQKTACYQQLSEAQLAEIREMYWSMPPTTRAQLIRTLFWDSQRNNDFETCAKTAVLKTDWHLAGIKVCFSGFAHSLGTSEPTLRKAIHGEMDSRCLRQHSVGVKAQVVDFFFYELYLSAAEGLPEGPLRKKAHGSAWVDADIQYDEGPWLFQGDAIQPELGSNDWNPDAFHIDHLRAITLGSRGLVTGLPQRALPHSRLHDLYWLFLACYSKLREVVEDDVSEQMGSGPATFVYFRQRWHRWKSVLYFRKSSQHSQCQTCFELQEGMRVGSWVSRMSSANKLKIHYQDQYLDRCLYWSQRFASRSGHDVLTVIIDSMDRTKFAWPRWPFAKLPKNLDGRARPRLVLTAAIAHGWAVDLSMADEDLNHGASAFCETLCRLLEKVSAISDETGRPFPQHLVVQSDNTTAQAKNNLTMIFFAAVVGRRKFSSCTLNFLMVGHTHEDVDQLFGVVSSLLIRAGNFQTPEEALGSLETNLGSHIRSKGERLFCYRLDMVRDFGDWVSPMHRQLYNGMMTRKGVEAPHSFSFKFRRDLTAAEAAKCHVPEEWGPAVNPAEWDDFDVMCCVKTYMRDKHLQQAPVCAIPAARIAMLVHGCPQLALPRNAFSKRQIDDYRFLTQYCVSLSLSRAATALQSLVAVRPQMQQLPNSSWLCSPGVARPVFHDGNPFFPHLPATSWRLLARDA
jgi:hypothetical protein